MNLVGTPRVEERLRHPSPRDPAHGLGYGSGVRRPSVSRRRAVLGGAAALLAGAAALAPVPAVAAPGAQAPPTHTVLVGAPGLAWSDIDRAVTPTLAQVARDGAVGSMTVRAVRSRSCAVDGWLTLSAGRRAADTAGAGCGEPAPVTDGTVPGWDRYVTAAGDQSYGAVPGTLGQALADAGQCVETVGPGAAVAGADLGGRVAHHLAEIPTDPGCAVTLVDAGTLPADGPARTRALRSLDALVERVLRTRGPDTRLVVAGVGDGVSAIAPRALVVSGPPAGVVTSSSTRQPGLVQLQDLTATLLATSGADPGDVTGRPVTVVADDGSGAARVEDRVGFERRATTMRAVAPQVTGWLAALFTAWAVVVALLSWRGRPRPAALLAAGVAVATVPVSTFVANLVPWWRLDSAGPVFLSALAVAVGLTTWLALVVGRRLDLGALRAVAVVTLVVLGGDVLLGSGLQLASVFGQNPVVGGRFYGLGNTSFALYGLAALVVVQWVGATRRLPRRWAVALAGGVLLLAVALEAHPSLGADFGGPPGLLLGGLLVLAAAAGVRVTPLRALVAVGVAAGLAVGVALADWLRPPQSRTHLGEFVQTVLDGGAGEVVARKLAQNLANLGSPALIAMALAAGLVALALWRSAWRPGPAGTIVLRGALVLSAVGFAVNDSGLVIPAYVAVVLAPLLLADRAAREGGEELRWPRGGAAGSHSSSLPASPSPPTRGT